MPEKTKRGRKPKTLAARTVRVSFARYDRARAILESLLAGTLKPAVVPAGYVLGENGIEAVRPANNAKVTEWRAYADNVANLPKVQAAYTAANLNVITLANSIREGMAVTRDNSTTEK